MTISCGDPVLDVCSACESGVIYRAQHPNDPDWSSSEPCSHCDGTGFILIDADAAEMEDLDSPPPQEASRD